MQPTSLPVTEDILALIAELDEFKGAWRALSTLAPDRLGALRRVATIESIGSSTRIEGAQLSDRAVEDLLANPEAKSFRSRDEQEVAGYALVMDIVFENFGALDLAENHIKQLHRDLLKYSTKDERHRGGYKTLPNDVAAFDAEGKTIGIVFKTATPFDTPRLMSELTEWTRRASEERRHHPLLIVAVFVVTFLAIHPFQDGNGRLSRALTTLLLLRAGYAYVPYSSLEHVIEHSKDRYYLALRRTQMTIWGENVEWEHWTEYFLRALQRQKRNLEEKIQVEKLLHEALPKLSLDILERVKMQGRTNLAELATVTGANRSTIKKHLQSLVASRHLTRQGTGKATWYILGSGLPR